MKSRAVFILSLCLIVIALCALSFPAAMVVPPVVAQQTFATLPVFITPIPPTNTPVPTLTLLPRPTVVGCPTPLFLIPGQLVVVTGGLNVRSEPSLSAPLITYFSEERRVRLIGGPACSDDFVWWQITAFGGEPGATSGWVIERARTGEIYIEPAIIAPDEPCFAPLPFAVGEVVTAVTGVRLRNAPSQSAYTTTVVPINGTMTVLEGPNCQDGINWWRVSTMFQTSGQPIGGWVAEGFPENYWLIGIDAVTGATDIPCVRPLTLDIGSRIAVNYRDGVLRRLRAAPSVGSAVILQMPDGIALEVIASAPVCANGYQWWNVRVLTTDFVGWIAEGRPGRYNIEIITSAE